MGYQTGGRVVKKSNRQVIVFFSLISALTLTSALLLALSPAPLTMDGSSSLFAIDAPESMDVVFQTEIAVKPGRWKYIYIHHSKTPTGSAMTLARGNSGIPDHFIIGNGDGAADGQVQVAQRWNEQVSANPPAGAMEIDPACISICLIGDFDRALPTAMQIRRLTNLVNALQSRFDIPAGQVLAIGQGANGAAIGRYFPTTAFRDQLLP
jgi:N-acetyl-anhydromuramyl-L-alanine amidase AmpD